MYEKTVANVVQIVLDFMDKHEITHEEQIYQNDQVSLDACQFIDDLFQATKLWREEE